ncbi:RNA-splicing factor [Thoreauomyces humboldtii]|nr:RNA-splicing factor [Thoreauomyces humboldtii]
MSTLRPRERDHQMNQPFDDRPPPMRKPNKDILDHQKKREVEVKCLVLQDQLEAQDLPEEEVEKRVDALRQELLRNLSKMSQDVKTLQGHQVHELAEAKEKADARARDAFGIRSDFVAGASFDRELQERVKIEKAQAHQALQEEREQRAKEAEKKRKEDAKASAKLAKRSEKDRKSRGAALPERRRQEGRGRDRREATDQREAQSAGHEREDKLRLHRRTPHLGARDVGPAHHLHAHRRRMIVVITLGPGLPCALAAVHRAHHLVLPLAVVRGAHHDAAAHLVDLLRGLCHLTRSA